MRDWMKRAPTNEPHCQEPFGRCDSCTSHPPCHSALAKSLFMSHTPAYHLDLPQAGCSYKARPSPSETAFAGSLPPVPLLHGFSHWCKQGKQASYGRPSLTRCILSTVWQTHFFLNTVIKTISCTLGEFFWLQHPRRKHGKFHMKHRKISQGSLLHSTVPFCKGLTPEAA